jgi:NAD(P)-dependent dehydrogenase (short-subunit alcohol dehydrogenase family)
LGYFASGRSRREKAVDLSLKDKVAVVTGGSRGIGKATARALAREDTDVALIARNMADAEITAKAIAQESERTLRCYNADTGDEGAVRNAFTQIAKDFGRLDILVNAAAQVAGQAPAPKLTEMTNENFWTEVNVKVLGYLRCAREAVPHMQKSGWGRIINISGLAARSTGSIIGTIRNISVAALTKNLADELGPIGINVTCVHPGATRTEKTAAVLQRRAEAAQITSQEIERRMAEANTISRLVTAEDVADVVAFLASSKSIAVNGDAIAAGGRDAWSYLLLILRRGIALAIRAKPQTEPPPCGKRWRRINGDFLLRLVRIHMIWIVEETRPDSVDDAPRRRGLGGNGARQLDLVPVAYQAIEIDHMVGSGDHLH